MDISCEIIQDLLPLYAENMASDATKEMVEHHLCGCEACTRELDSLRNTRQVPSHVEVKSLKRVGDAIRRRRILSVMAVFLFIATVLIGCALMLDATIYLSAGEAVEDIYVEADGVKIVWNDQIIGTSALVATEDSSNYAVTAWTNLYSILFPTERVPYEQLSDEIKALVTEAQYAAFDNSSFYSLENPYETNFIYENPIENSMTLLLNADQPFPEGPMMDVEPYTVYYVYSFVGVCVLACLMAMYFRGKWSGELFWRLSIVAGSLALSAVIVTAGQLSGLTGHFHETLVDSTAVALPMTLFGLCVRQLIKLHRQDKGL